MRLNDCLRVLGDCLGVYHAATFEKAPPAEASGEVEEGDNVAQVPRCASVFMPSPVMRSYRQPWRVVLRLNGQVAFVCVD